MRIETRMGWGERTKREIRGRRRDYASADTRRQSPCVTAPRPARRTRIYFNLLQGFGNVLVCDTYRIFWPSSSCGHRGGPRFAPPSRTRKRILENAFELKTDIKPFVFTRTRYEGSFETHTILRNTLYFNPHIIERKPLSEKTDLHAIRIRSRTSHNGTRPNGTHRRDDD